MMGFVVDPNQLKQILLEREKRVVGGVDVLIIGRPGCGKTTGLVKIADSNKRKYNDVIIWRSSSECQWTFFLNLPSPPKLVLWLKDGVKFTLFDRKTEKEVDPKRYFWKIRNWKDAKDLIKRLDKDNINVVQTTPFSPLDPRQHIQFCRDWLSIVFELNHRFWKNPVSWFFDEIEDAVPEGKGKDFWDVELALSSVLRSLRKNDVSSFLAGHSTEEIHWRIRKKIRWKIYMQGGRPESKSRITVNINKLPVGWGWIEGDQIEKFRFKSLGKEHKLRAIITDENFIN